MEFVILCDCEEKLGVSTDNGLMIGNIIVSTFIGKCLSCGKHFVWSRNELITYKEDYILDDTVDDRDNEYIADYD